LHVMLMRTSRPWTEEEDAQLLRLARRNLPHYRLGHAMGRTTQGVKGRLHKLRKDKASSHLAETGSNQQAAPIDCEA